MVDTLSLEGKVAIITGSGRETGIGAATAIALARNGASVTINYMSDSTAPRAANVLKSIRDAGGKAIAVQADVTKPEEIKRLVDETLKGFNTDKIDILGEYAEFARTTIRRCRGATRPQNHMLHNSRQWLTRLPASPSQQRRRGVRRAQADGGHARGYRRHLRDVCPRADPHDAGCGPSHAPVQPHHQRLVHCVQAVLPRGGGPLRRRQGGYGPNHLYRGS